MTGRFDLIEQRLKSSGESLSSRSPARGARDAAVLVALSDADRPDIVYVEKGPWLRRHAGQLAFPGGMGEPGDADSVTTALREAKEEIGLVGVSVLGLLDAAFLAASEFDVTTVIGTWDGHDRLAVRDASEIVAVHRFAIDDLADPANRVTFRLGSHRGPAFVLGDLFLWGFSAWITDVVLRLGGWQRPWDASRELDVPKRFSAGS